MPRENRKAKNPKYHKIVQAAKEKRKTVMVTPYTDEPERPADQDEDPWREYFGADEVDLVIEPQIYTCKDSGKRQYLGRFKAGEVERVTRKYPYHPFFAFPVAK